MIQFNVIVEVDRLLAEVYARIAADKAVVLGVDSCLKKAYFSHFGRL